MTDCTYPQSLLFLWSVTQISAGAPIPVLLVSFIGLSIDYGTLDQKNKHTKTQAGLCAIVEPHNVPFAKGTRLHLLKGGIPRACYEGYVGGKRLLWPSLENAEYYWGYRWLCLKH